MADEHPPQPKPADQPEPPAPEPDELTAEQLEQVAGGATFQDFHFVKKIDKTSPM